MTQVSIIRCMDYEYEKVYEAVKRSVDLIGGMGAFVKNGARVLLKPNMLSARGPEKAVTTHPSVVKAVIRLVKEAGGNPFIGDSSFELLFGKSDGMEKIAEVTGIKEVADEMGVEVKGFKESVLVKSDSKSLFKEFEIARDVVEADVVINLPKIKTHSQIMMTLAVKNLFGCVVGNRKALWHFKAGKDHSYFASMLVDLYQTIKPALTIMDGIIGLEGNGPGSSGLPKNLEIIMAGVDCIALDTVVCEIVGLQKKELPTWRSAFERRIGETNIKKIEISGEDINTVKVDDFLFPETCDLHFGPKFMRGTLKNLITPKPVEDKSKCTQCGDCVAGCPTHIIKLGQGGLIFNYDNCIRCFCCIEICPEGAMHSKKGFLTSFVGG